MPGTKDPLELEDNFLEKDNQHAEEEFKKEYGDPFIERKVDTTTAPKFDEGETEEQKTARLAEEEGKEEPFKFDDALDEAEKVELKELNEKFNTNFESVSDFKDSLKKADNKEEVQQVDENRRYIDYFNTVLQYKDDQIVLEDKRMLAQSAGKDLNDEEVQEEIEMEMEKLRDGGFLPYAANSIRDTVKNALREKKAVVDGYDNKQKLSKEETELKSKTELQDSLAKVFKEGQYMGVKPTREDMLKIYERVSKGKHINHLKANQQDAVEFELFQMYKAVIAKNLGKPDFNAGVKSTLDEIGMSSSEPGNDGADSTKDSEDGNLTYLQRFAK